MSSTKPLITVITPAYNVSAYIGEAMDSVTSQQEARFEYLVVDDGSTDNTVEIVMDRASKDDRIRLIKGNHAGSGAARNLGIREARGEYIAFVDGDDRWSPLFLKELLASIENAPTTVGAVFCRTRVIDEQGRVYWRRWRPAIDYDFDSLLVQDCPPGNGSALLLRRSCFDEAGLFDEELRSGVDFDMWLRIARDAKSPIFRGIKPALVDLRVRSGAISRDLEGRLASMQALLDRFVPSLRHTPASHAYARPAVVAFRAGNDETGERWGGQAKNADIAWLLRDSYGRRVLIWQMLNRSQREAGRKLSALLKKEAIKLLSIVSTTANKIGIKP